MPSIPQIASLSDRQRCLLGRAQRSARSYREFQAVRGLALKASGWTPARIAAALGDPAEVIDRWMGRLLTGAGGNRPATADGGIAP